jgi:hypothetical protein
MTQSLVVVLGRWEEVLALWDFAGSSRRAVHANSQRPEVF